MTRTFRLLRLLPLLALAGQVLPAHAHAHLKTSTPANQAELREPPTALELEFSEAAKLTALSLQAGGEATAHKVPLNESTSSVRHRVALPALGPGNYVVTWRALSDDSHVSSGTIKFAVRPK